MSLLNWLIYTILWYQADQFEEAASLILEYKRLKRYRQFYGPQKVTPAVIPYCHAHPSHFSCVQPIAIASSPFHNPLTDTFQIQFSRTKIATLATAIIFRLRNRQVWHRDTSPRHILTKCISKSEWMIF